MFKPLMNEKIFVKQKETESLWAEAKTAMQCKTLALLKMQHWVPHYFPPS